MIAIFNSLPVKDGASDDVVERFANSQGSVQGFPGFHSMEVLKTDGGEGGGEEVLVITRWESREDFDAWVASAEFKQAHGRGGASELMRGRPRMSSYEVAVRRGPAQADV
jgi:heme oxygenase (staphylobilin-producing)